MQVMALPIKKQEQGITTRGTECAAALLGAPLRDLSKKKVFINVNMQLSMAIHTFILKIKNLTLGFICQYFILKCSVTYCLNFNSP